MRYTSVTSRLRPLLALVALSAVVLLFSANCGLLGDEDDNGSTDDGTTASSNYEVLQAVMGTALNEQRQITGGAGRVFPSGTTEVHAVVVVQGVQIGDEITGRWFQLSTQDVPPAGAFVSEAGVTLSQDNLTQEGQARVSLDLFANQGSLPVGDWVVRIYVNGEFVRTMGFVIIPEENQGSAEPTPTIESTSTAEPTPATSQPEPSPTQVQAAPETYTVVGGDTLTIIAEQFKTPAESTDAYIQRLLELNDMEPGSILFVGQELLLPPPQ